MSWRNREATRTRSFSAFTVRLWAISIAATTAVLLSAVLLIVSVHKADRLAVDRQRALIAAALDQSLARVGYEQESSTVWTEAARRVRQPSPDLDWLDGNLGIWFHSYYHHDLVFILDPAGQPIYAMEAGRRVAPTAFQSHAAHAAAPLVDDVRRQIHAPDYLAESPPSAGSADFALVEGHPAIVSVKPIEAERGEADTALNAGYMHISVVFLDHDFARTLSQSFRIEDPVFGSSPRDGSAVPLRSKDGRTLRYITWSPFRPGTIVSHGIAPAMLFAALLMGAVIFLLLRHLKGRTLALHASEAQAQYLASHDPLTGLPNRTLFQERVRRELTRVHSEGGQVAYLYLDLDGFKDVNDTFGHPAGDELIRVIAGELGDVLGEGDMAARVGGDEFAILQVESRGPADAEALCRRIRTMFDEPFKVGETGIAMGVSIGIAMGSRINADATELARKADVAMYEAKAAGGGWTFFSPAMDASRRGRRELELNLRDALRSEDQIEVHYQPTFAAKSLRLTGVEALARWRHPTRGWIDPASFIPVAEACGLIEELGLRVLREACAVARNWPVPTIAVNVSAVQLRDPTFADQVLAILTQNKLPPERLEIEVTETSFIDNAGACGLNLRRLHDVGVGIALDDFGTGYSSFSHLNGFSVDRIKIDRSFVAASGPGGEGQAIVRWIVNMAKTSGLKITAEGVETEEQQHYLARIGCNELQGYHLARPMPAHEIAALLQARGPEARRMTRRKPVVSEVGG